MIAYMDSEVDRTCGVNDKDGNACPRPTATVWVMTCRCGLHGAQQLRLCAGHAAYAEAGRLSDVECYYCASPLTPEPHWCPIDVAPSPRPEAAT